MTYRIGSNTVITTTDYASNTFASNGAFASVFYKTARALFTVQGENYGYAAGGGTSTGGTNFPFAISDILQSIDRFPFASATNATNIGDLIGRLMKTSSQTSTSRAYTGGGTSVSSYPILTPQSGTIVSNIRSYPFASVVVAQEAGLTFVSQAVAVGQSSITHGYVTGGQGPAGLNNITRFPFHSAFTTAASVGTLTAARSHSVGISSFDYGYTAGGVTVPAGVVSAVIDRFPFSVDVVSARSVGNLAVAQYSSVGNNSYDNGYISGGIPPVVTAFIIQRFPFAAATTNAADIGDLVTLTWESSGQSSFSHGYTAGHNTPGTPNPRTLITRFPFASSSITDAQSVGNLTANRGSAAGNQS